MVFNNFFDYSTNARHQVRNNDIANLRHNPFMVFANYLMDINEPGFYKERDIVICDHWYDDNSDNSLTFEVSSTPREIDGEHLATIEKMLSGNGNEATVIYDKASERTLIQTRKTLTNVDYVKVAALISKLMPWLFDETYKPSDKYIEMIKLVSADKWNDVCSLIGAADALYKSQIAVENFYKNFHTNINGRINALRKDINSYRNEIINLQKTISNYEHYIREKTFLILGLETEERKENDKEDVKAYAKSMNIVFRETGSSSVVSFETYGFLDNYDEENARIFINKGRGALYSGTGEGKAWKRFFTKIFLSGEYKLAVFSCHNVNTDSPSIHKFSTGEDFKTYKGNEYIISPHIMKYDCYGGNQWDIIQAISTFDSYSLFDNCKAANGNLNFGDDTVVRTFSDMMYREYCSGTHKILRSKSGEWKTVKEVYDECAAELGD